VESWNSLVTLKPQGNSKSRIKWGDVTEHKFVTMPHEKEKANSPGGGSEFRGGGQEVLGFISRSYLSVQIGSRKPPDRGV